MANLSLIDIGNSIINPTVCIRVPELKNGEPIRNVGILSSSSGSFCVVYPYILSTGEKKALRIWHCDFLSLKDIPTTTEKISKELAKINSNYLVGYDYYDKGILVNGSLYPLVVMEWCKGMPLKSYMESNLDNKVCLNKLANDFLQMTRKFHSLNISHGDLQHGNIMIENKGQIKVIDYDSVYLPILGDKPEMIKGYPSYQHPQRVKNKYLSSKADYFSELVIFISIMAIAEKPSLWTKYNVKQYDSRLLMTQDDYRNLRSSEIYRDISSINPLFTGLFKILEHYLSKSDINELEPFDVIAKRMGLQLPSLIESFYCTHCGSKFMDDSDNYCTDCGTKRCDL
jgi:serine/threonine protein kinase